MGDIYSQTFKKKPTISLAPDAIVKVNGLVEVQICSYCKGTIFLSEYITNVSTSLATNGTVGTANFTISMPRHGHESKYMIRKGRVYGIKLMDEIEIYIKGRFNQGSDRDSVYYKVFWGFIVNIQESYSDGFLNLSVGCESILKWLQIMKTNENPSAVFFSDSSSGKYADFAATRFASKSYANFNPYEIIVSLCVATYRNIVTPSALDTESINQSTEVSRNDSRIVSPEEEELIRYWAERFSKIADKLKLFGVKQKDIEKIAEKTTSPVNPNSSIKKSVSSDPFKPFAVNYDNTQLMDFRPFLTRDDAKAQIEYSASSYKSNLEIANEVKLHTGFEFYLDTNGDIIFKPPFWNLNTFQNPVFVLYDEDILSYDFSEDANQVITRVDVTGEIFFDDQTSSDQKPRATFTDWSLARQFGIKEELIVARYYQKPEMCFYHAISELDRINANRYSGSVTVIGRPELRLGYPVYIVSRDLFGYVENISHNFSFGGSFTTQIELSAIRKRHKADNRILTPIKNTASTNTSSANNTSDPLAKQVLTKDQQNYQSQAPDASTRKANYKTNRNVKYQEISAGSKEGLAILAKINDAKKRGNAMDYLTALEEYIPVSDEDGFELVGTYENGRRFKLTSDYKLRLKDSSTKTFNQKPVVDNNNNSDYNGAGIEKILKPKIEVANDPSTSNPDLNYTPRQQDVGASLEEDYIGDFSKTTYVLASQLSPKDDAGKGCSCSQASDANKVKVDNTNSKKTMVDLKIKK